MANRITFWKCPECYGTGRVICLDDPIECPRCAGTGNALVNGLEEYHKRLLRELDEKKVK